jgi:hypothetical protein
MTMAGVLAAQAKHASSSTIVRVVDKKVANSTGGVVPVGQAGLPGFADVHYSTWGPKTAYPAYNYSLLQQGLTADVKCKESSSSPMSRTIVMVVPVTNSAAHGRMILQNLTFADGDCGIRKYSRVQPIVRNDCLVYNDTKLLLLHFTLPVPSPPSTNPTS